MESRTLSEFIQEIKNKNQEKILKKYSISTSYIL